MQNSINRLTINGFKSIKQLEDFELNALNVLIGGNGAGKSNFIQLFRMLSAMTQKSFTQFIEQRGGAYDFLFNGPKETKKINAQFEFISNSLDKSNVNSYKFELLPTLKETFLVNEERKYSTTNWWSYGAPTGESRLHELRDERSEENESWNGVGCHVFESITNWMVYHFHDTTPTAPMRRSEIIEDCKRLRSDASNLAPFLLNLRESKVFHDYYDKITDVIKLAIPFFDDFLLDVIDRGESKKVKLSWLQKGSDYPMQPYHLSDGSIRFICLTVALLQPTPPSLIIIDEPELGLHPQAISLLAELIETTSERTQVIVSTQSPALIDHFAIEDIITVNRDKGATTFERLNESDFNVWLENYSIGELWSKNVILGGPVHE